MTATCNGWMNAIPVVYDAPFVAASKAFLAALLKHLQGNPSVFYVRAGFVEGGEDVPVCVGKWPGWDGGGTFFAYLQDMASYVESVRGDVIFADDVATDPFGSDAAADLEAAIFADAGIGSGMEALEATDPASYDAGQPCRDDWCNWVAHSPNEFHYLQPAISQLPPALAEYVPFAASLGVNALELFSDPDLLLAYDPNFPGYYDAGVAYRAALQAL